MKLYEKINNGTVYVIAEMSANHGGSLENALKLVEEVKKAGADCLKTQTYTADTLTISCDREDFKIKNGLWKGRTYYDLYSEAYTPWNWQKEIKAKCEELGMDFLSTPFDRTAVDYLESIDVEFYKIASFELVDIPLIEYVASKGKPIIISCGMATLDEIEEAIAACKKMGNEKIILLKCCSQYPATYEEMNISVIPDMEKKFGFPVGLSDHSMGSLVDVVAVSMGAKVIEKHVCLNKEIESADMFFSLDVKEFSKMVEDVRNASLIKGNVTYKLSEKESERRNSRKSLYAVKEIKEGEIFCNENIRSIRPGRGIQPKYYESLLGKKAKKDYVYGEAISMLEIE